MARPSTDQRDRRFTDRHIGPDSAQSAAMLDRLGFSDIDGLLGAALPAGIAGECVPQLPDAASEAEVLAELRGLADRNQLVRPLIGTGYSPAHTPSVLLRGVLENPAWYTAYTPYQPEISQGRLEALLTFQTMITDLTALDVANASLLDEGTAAAEAMAFARRVVRGADTAETFVIDADCHPQTIDVVSTRAAASGVKAVVAELDDPNLDLAGVFGVLAQYPGTSGRINDLAPLAAKVHAAGALLVVAADLLALTLLRAPGEAGADVAVGSTQRFGLPLWFGGPHAAYMAVREAHQRQLPGRLVGTSIDSAGRPALRLALQTREQHIRREKATSNICTAQVLPAVVAAFYAQWHGPEGLRAIASTVAELTARLAAGLAGSPHDVLGETAFDTVRVRIQGPASRVVSAAAAAGFDLLQVDAGTVGISLDETCDESVVRRLLAILGGDESAADRPAPSLLPASLARTSGFLAHERFHAYRSETEMMRYLRRLSDRDLALDRTMIPLGSCTMKLNAATEMAPISWREFTDVHPFAPAERSAGYRALIADLESWLAELSGYDAVSVQPNSGAQGEFAGLLAIRRYHESNGENARDIVLVPASAHGTNAASASLAGLRVAVVKTAGDGSIDLDDLRAVLAKHEGTVAGLMITYPSTHGVYEPTVREVCALVHEAGGQVYLDGANLNALVGVSRPGDLGADVSHFNLHKTFCIPHGGGGPGVGPVGVKAHLAPFLPASAVVAGAGPESSPGAVAAAPWGSAGVLPISWAYIRLMGAEGLRSATGMAVLSANYIAARLREAYPVLYAGPGGLVAHECILDLRAITAASGVTVEDVAKRLIDYGFHAPTMSFPVAGTLMVEPTESESLAELDRFCDAMLGIREEIAAVERGEVAAADSVLRGAPHDAHTVSADEWARAYPRSLAAWPGHAVAGGPRIDKYWPPVGRIDNAYGDRNLVCTCPPVEAYED
jgi:glycine dehydrogenase